MFECEISAIIQHPMYGQFRAPNAAVFLSEQSASDKTVQRLVDYFCLNEGDSGITSEFWVVSKEQLPQLMAQVRTATTQCFRDYASNHDDGVVVGHWSTEGNPWVMVGVFNSFDAELGYYVDVGNINCCYHYNILSCYNSYMQLLHDLKPNIHKTGFPTECVIELWADMRSDHTVTPNNFLMGFMGTVVGYEDMNSVSRHAIEHYIAQQQAYAIEAALPAGARTHTRKI